MKKLVNIPVYILLTTALFCCKRDFNVPLKSPQVSGTHDENRHLALSIADMHPFKVLSFNIRRYDQNDNPPDPQTITERQPLIRQIIIDNNPDIFGFQEFLNAGFKAWVVPQMDSLGYDHAEIGITSNPVFFKKSRFSLQWSKAFYLDPAYPHQNAVTAILKDLVTSKTYFICNTHWIAGDQPGRVGNARALIDSIKVMNPGLQAIIMGDLNAQPDATEYKMLRDTFAVLDGLWEAQSGPTTHGWDATGEVKLDYILATRGLAELSSAVIKTSYNGFWPSDHWPIVTTFIPGIFGASAFDTHGLSISNTTKFYFADIDGDGKEDKVYWNKGYDSGKPQVFISNGDGTFTFASAHTAGASTLSTTSYFFADVNGDGKADEIQWDPTQNSGHTRVYLATSGGNFSGTVIDNPEGISQSNTTTYSFADINGDGKADKIYWNAGYDNGHTRVYFAAGNGSFSSSVVSPSAGASTTADTRFYYADVDGDGREDKVLWHPALNSGQTMVYLSDGDGNFTYSSTFSTGGAVSVSNATRFFFADVDGDGRADKMYWNPGIYLGEMKVHYSKTTNSFDSPVYNLLANSESSGTEYYFADINGDGKKDLIRWNYGQNNGALKNFLAR